jgi:hypothetical protein
MCLLRLLAQWDNASGVPSALEKRHVALIVVVVVTAGLLIGWPLGAPPAVGGLAVVAVSLRGVRCRLR